jgi:hypothetical protein
VVRLLTMTGDQFARAARLAADRLPHTVRVLRVGRVLITWPVRSTDQPRSKRACQ